MGDAGGDLGLLGAAALGEGAGGGGRELEPVCRGAAEWNRWLGAGRGYVAGRRRLRGPGAEERGISTPQVSREKRPSPPLPRERGRASACPFSPHPENRPRRPRRPPGGAPLTPGTPRVGGVQAARRKG